MKHNNNGHHTASAKNIEQLFGNRTRDDMMAAAPQS